MFISHFWGLHYVLPVLVVPGFTLGDLTGDAVNKVSEAVLEMREASRAVFSLQYGIWCSNAYFELCSGSKTAGSQWKYDKKRHDKGLAGRLHLF